MAFEYKREVKSQSDFPHSESEQAYLNKRGEDGWQLSFITKLAITPNKTELHAYYFQRQIERFKLSEDELWDDFSEYIGEDIDSLNVIAGTSVITKGMFKKMYMHMSESIKNGLI